MEPSTLSQILGFFAFFAIVWIAQTVWEYFAGKDTNDYGYPRTNKKGN